LKYDAKAAAAFYDEYGEREWTRFEDGRTPAASVATHTHYLRRFVAHGDRVTRPGGHVLVSVMALVGATINAIDGVLAIADGFGSAALSGVTASGLLPREYGGHLPMKMYRWRELRDLLSPHGEIVAASATGLGAEPALDAGRHILAVVRV
jgi:hypothetical protein